ncbi:ATP-binding protein [Shewanella putrefaciens]|uniref:ATP-binding protein n=1 Tax=Shewanella putrefaciens TaxID=24 RepID=UPI0027DCCD19|nr:ATP-binding protein [Shewanella putrefaciens]
MPKTISIYTPTPRLMKYITIKDDGPGIDASELDAIFKPFLTVRFGKTERKWWLGFRTCHYRSCITAHKGKIKAKNRVPHGLEVNITLPFKP